MPSPPPSLSVRIIILLIPSVLLLLPFSIFSEFFLSPPPVGRSLSVAPSVATAAGTDDELCSSAETAAADGHDSSREDFGGLDSALRRLAAADGDHWRTRLHGTERVAGGRGGRGGEGERSDHSKQFWMGGMAGAGGRGRRR